MAPQVASLSELSRIRGDAEVRYPYAITEPRLSPPGLDRETAAGGGRKMRGLEGREGIFVCRDREEERRTTRVIKINKKARTVEREGDMKGKEERRAVAR